MVSLVWFKTLILKRVARTRRTPSEGHLVLSGQRDMRPRAGGETPQRGTQFWVWWPGSTAAQGPPEHGEGTGRVTRTVTP